MHIPNARQFHIHPSMIGDEAVSVPLGALYRQMVSVLRLSKGDTVRFFDGLGTVVEGAIAHISKDAILVHIDNRHAQTHSSHLTLAIAILKNDRMRFVLEKATELGVKEIIPMITERVVKRPPQAPPRWNVIVKEAAEQSGRAWLPAIAPVQTLGDILARPERKLLMSTNAVQTLENVDRNEAIVIIGPEGGFTDQELATAEAHGAMLLSLGPYQFRADTATLVTLARLSA